MIRGPSSRTLDRLERRLTAFLSDLCKIEVQSSVQDEFGGMQDVWTLVGNNIACRLYPVMKDQGAGMQSGTQETIVQTFRLVVPKDTALSTNQRVTVNSDVFHVVEVVTSHTDAVDAQAILKRAI